MTVSFLSSEDFDERAHQCYDAGEYDLALEILREGLRRYPDAVDLHVGIGYVRMAREEFAWAWQSFQTALELEADHEDAWVGMGEVLLKFGHTAAALGCFARVDEMELEDQLDLGLAMGRALYREGMFRESRQRLAGLGVIYPDSSEVHAALGYTLHALGDEVGAARELRRSLRLEPDFHEARIYLSHILYERGDFAGALRELDRVPPAEHWDPLSLWRAIDLKISRDGFAHDDPSLLPWRMRLAELETEPDAIDHLLAEVETSFSEEIEEPAPARVLDLVGDRVQARRVTTRVSGESAVETRGACHRVRTREGDIFVGTWEQIVKEMRDRTSDTSEPISLFMFRASLRIRRLTGCELPHGDAEAFVRGSASLGLLEIEA
jgi:tetratricopeptide (TPR) repeat protein